MTTIGNNICHYYVDIVVFECEAFCKGFITGSCENPNKLQMKVAFVDLIILASRPPLQNNSNVFCFFVFAKGLL